jgi:uncharacterized protein YkwD
MRIGTRLAVAAITGIAACGLASGQLTSQPEEVRATAGPSAAVRAEKDLYAAVNQARRNQGMAPLRWNDSLAASARHHAAIMAEHRSVQHGFEGEPSLSARVKQTGAHFSWLSENVTQGSGARSIHAQFMESPKHRANILDADMNSIGVGVVERGGQLFAVEDFAALR